MGRNQYKYQYRGRAERFDGPKSHRDYYAKYHYHFKKLTLHGSWISGILILKSHLFSLPRSNLKHFSWYQDSIYAGKARLIYKSKMRIRLVPLCRRFVSGNSANGRRQNCLCSQLDRNTTNQRDKACDICSPTSLWDTKAFRGVCSSSFQRDVFSRLLNRNGWSLGLHQRQPS